LVRDPTASSTRTRGGPGGRGGRKNELKERRLHAAWQPALGEKRIGFKSKAGSCSFSLQAAEREGGKEGHESPSKHRDYFSEGGEERGKENANKTRKGEGDDPFAWVDLIRQTNRTSKKKGKGKTAIIRLIERLQPGKEGENQDRREGRGTRRLFSLSKPQEKKGIRREEGERRPPASVKSWST